MYIYLYFHIIYIYIYIYIYIHIYIARAPRSLGVYVAVVGWEALSGGVVALVGAGRGEGVLREGLGIGHGAPT